MKYLIKPHCYKNKINVQNNLLTSLENLQTDYIDLLYIHWPKAGADMRSMMQELEKARKQEIIKYIEAGGMPGCFQGMFCRPIGAAQTEDDVFAELNSSLFDNLARLNLLVRTDCYAIPQ